jgi:hypothetical protein
MLKVSQEVLKELEERYPGITDNIMHFENAELPACPNCGSEDTADVQVGIIGRTINIAGATSRFKLIANAPKEGDYFCNHCETFFSGEGGNMTEQNENTQDEATPIFYGRPQDRSYEAFVEFIDAMVSRLAPNAKDVMTEEKMRASWKKFWKNADDINKKQE